MRQPNTDTQVQILAANEFVAGRSARNGETCSNCPKPAVSAFEIDGRPAGAACESHIIAVHEAAEASLKTAPKEETYQRGTAVYRVNMTQVKTGTRVLLARNADGTLGLAVRKTGALIATVTAPTERAAGYRQRMMRTSLGTVEAPAAQTMWAQKP